MDRKAFFSAVRASLFGGSLTAGQVEGMNAILDAAPDFMPEEYRAYCLATALHETARTMQPIKEYGGAAYFKKMYDIQGARPAKARELGNLSPGDGVKFAGRGYVQLTGRSNYARASKETGFDLVAAPDLAMQPSVAAVIMYSGMTAGWFTGKRLADYLPADPVNARRIINGTDKAAQIAIYHGAFLAAFKASRAFVGRPPVAVAPPPLAVPPASPPPASSGLFSALLNWLSKGLRA